MLDTTQDTLAKFEHIKGENCLTSSLRNLLTHLGYRMEDDQSVTEAMIFGLGEGLYTWYADFDRDNTLPVLIGQHPYLEFLLTENLGVSLTLETPVGQSDDPVLRRLRQGLPTIVKSDPYYIEAFWEDLDDDAERFHFGQHVTLGVFADDDHVWLSDIDSADLAEVPIEQFQASRFTNEGPEALRANGRWFQLDETRPVRPISSDVIERSITNALQNNVNAKGKFGVEGLMFAARDFPAWLKQLSVTKPSEIETVVNIFAIRMDETAANSFSRLVFFDFLDQAEEMVGLKVARHLGAEKELVSSWVSLIAEFGELPSTIESGQAQFEFGLESISQAMTAIAEKERKLWRTMLEN